MFVKCPQCRKKIWIRNLLQAVGIALNGCLKHADFTMEFSKGCFVYCHNRNDIKREEY